MIFTGSYHGSNRKLSRTTKEAIMHLHRSAIVRCVLRLSVIHLPGYPSFARSRREKNTSSRFSSPARSSTSRVNQAVNQAADAGNNNPTLASAFIAGQKNFKSTKPAKIKASDEYQKFRMLQHLSLPLGFIILGWKHAAQLES